MKILKQLAALCLILSSLLFCTACGEDPVQERKDEKGLILGVIADLTPQKAEDGKTDRVPEDRSFYFGVQFAINQFIKAGQNGLKIRLVTYDLQGDEERLSGAYETFTKEGVEAILCLSKYASAVAKQASLDGIPVLVPDADEQGIPPLSVGSDGEDEDDKDTENVENLMQDYPGVYSLMGSPECFGRTAAFFMKLSSYTSALVLTEEEDVFFRNASAAFEEAAKEYGITIVESVTVRIRDKETMEEVRDQLFANKADMLFLSCPLDWLNDWVYPTIFGSVYDQKQIVYAGAQSPLPILQGEGEEDYLPQSSLRRAAHAFGVFSDAAKKHKNGEFGKNYEALYGLKPDLYAVLGYDGASVLLQAVREAGDGEGTLLREKLNTMEFEGVYGSFSFEESGYAKRGYTIAQFALSDDYATLSETTRFEYLRVKDADSSEAS